MRRIPALVAALAIALLSVPATTATTASAADGPTVKVSEAQAGTGGSVVVTGTGWQPKTLLMMLICGRSEPGRGVIGGTNSCANADGRAVTTDANGGFSKVLPVVEPPVPCPCVVHVVTVTGSSPASGDAAFQVAGHPVEPLPAEVGTGRLSVLTDPRLDGSSGLLTWFGAPPRGRWRSPSATSARGRSRTRSSTSAPPTGCSPRSGTSSSGAARSRRAGKHASNCR